MTPEQLKASILQWAMEGKLVKQDPNDEPASILLEKIKAEKSKLVKEGKIKKSKKLPAIKNDEKPFKIPASWEWGRLDEVLDVRDGTHDTPKYVIQGVPLITSKNISKGYLDFDNVKYISEKDAEKINVRSKVSKNDIIFAMIGSIGNPIIVNSDRNFAIKNVALLKNFSKVICIRFIFYYLLIIQNAWRKNAQGAVQKFISLKKIRNSIVPIPPLNEQRRIVAKTERLMPLVDKYAEAYNRLKAIDDSFDDKLKQSILQYAMEGKLVKQDPSDEPASVLLKKINAEKEKLVKTGKIKKSKKLPPIKDSEKPFKIPKSWQWVRLGNICISNIGVTYRPIQKREAGLPILRANNIKNGKINRYNLVHIDEPNIKGKYLLKQGDILMAVRSGSARLVGKSAVVNKKYVNWSFGAFMSKIRLFNCNSYFVNYFIASKVFRDQLGDANTTTINQITQKMINHFVLPVPPLTEQGSIVKKLSQIFKEIEKKV